MPGSISTSSMPMPSTAWAFHISVLILPDVDRLPSTTYEKILAFARARRNRDRDPASACDRARVAAMPTKKPARLKEISESLFHGNIASAHFVEDETHLARNSPKMLHRI